MANQDQWFYETQIPGIRLGLERKKVLFKDKSDFQDVEIFEHEFLGKVLILGGAVMLSERDEFIYHDCLVHVGATTHPNPQRALVIGGGDGGSIRELTKYKSLSEIHLCEIDGMVVDSCKTHIPLTSSKLNDPRVSVFIKDGFDFLKNHKNYYDLICVDSTDPVGEAKKLFEKPFFQLVHDALTQYGIMTCQNESPLYNTQIMFDSLKEIRSVFPKVAPYFAPIPMYPSGYWSFAIATKGIDPLTQVNKVLSDEISKQTRFYSTKHREALFSKPATLEDHWFDLPKA